MGAFITSAGDIRDEYDVIGYVEANESVSELIQVAKQKGADALIHINQQIYVYRTGSTFNGVGDYTVNMGRVYYGTAVRLKPKEPVDQILLTRERNFGQVLDTDMVDMSIIFSMTNEKSSVELQITNNERRKVEAISINAVVNTIFGERYELNNLHFYYNKRQYTGEQYESKAVCNKLDEDIINSISDVQIEVNKIVYGDSIVSKAEEAADVARKIEEKKAEEKKINDNREYVTEMYNEYFGMVKDCKLASEMHKGILSKYPDGRCGCVQLNMDELQKIVDSEARIGNMRGRYVQKLRQYIIDSIE